MNVTKRTESIYEIEFDPSEIEALEYFKQMYNITAEMLIDMSLENSFNQGLNNSENTIRRNGRGRWER